MIEKNLSLIRQEVKIILPKILGHETDNRFFSEMVTMYSWNSREDLLSYMSRSEIATARILQKLASCSSLRHWINAWMLSETHKTSALRHWIIWNKQNLCNPTNFIYFFIFFSVRLSAFGIMMLRFWLGDCHFSGSAPLTSDLLRVGGRHRAGVETPREEPLDPESNDLSFGPARHTCL